MNEIQCYLCGSEKYEEVQGKVRDNNKLKILKCSNCGLVFLDSFDHINETFYNNSQMRKGDINKEWITHINECSIDDSRRAEWIKPMITNKSILDFGCGGGGFLLKIKHLTSIVEGIEKDNYFRNILEKVV